MTMSTRLLFLWALQWECVERQRRRLDLSCASRPTKDGWDDVVNFFIHAFSLLDWLVSEGVMTREKRNDAIARPHCKRNVTWRTRRSIAS